MSFRSIMERMKTENRAAPFVVTIVPGRHYPRVVHNVPSATIILQDVLFIRVSVQNNLSVIVLCRCTGNPCGSM